MTRAFAIVNPTAGGGRTGRRWPALCDTIVRAGCAIEWAATTARGDGVRLAREAALAGWPLVVAVGGDGTLNEVVDGVLSVGGHGATAEGAPAAVGAIMTGRGRDACRNFGVASDPGAAARRLLQGRAEPVDVGLVRWDDGSRRCFLGAAGVGFDATVARRSATGGGSGTVPYVRAIIASLAAHRPVHARLEVDGGTAWAGPLTSAVVANGAHFGGGMRIAPSAVPDDGVLDLIVLGALGRLELLWWLPTVYRGAHLRHPRVTASRARQVRITADEALPTHVDGEPTPPTPVTLSVLPRRIQLVR